MALPGARIARRLVGAARSAGAGRVDLTARIGSVVLTGPVMTAAGTAGHGAELADFFDLSTIGAVVVKSVSAKEWDGNPAPRVAEVAAGMINSVGLQNPGVEHWLAHDLPALHAAGARVVASIWGFTIAEYEAVATALRGVPGITAVEVNVSCPNVEDRRHMFAHSIQGTADVVTAVRRGIGAGVPLWAKLSPNVTALTDIAGSALDAGADAVTLINTVMGMGIDVETRKRTLGAGGGGMSGPAIRPVAVRAVFETRAQFPDAAIIGVGGITTGAHAVELLMAGADAVQVGTATFYEPTAAQRITRELREWCARHGVRQLDELIGAAHG